MKKIIFNFKNINFMTSTNKICLLVIDGTSMTNNKNYKRWLLEKYLWNILIDSYQKIDIYFLKCTNQNIQSECRSEHSKHISKLFNDKNNPEEISKTKISDNETKFTIKAKIEDLPEFAFQPSIKQLNIIFNDVSKSYTNMSSISKNEIYCNCTECLIPGIFQKTVVALNSLINKYDIFIRTNLSTIFFESNLIQLCEKYKNVNYPVYEGSRIDKYFHGYQYEWAMGNSIILNKLAARCLIHDGIQPQYFNNKNTPDDVLIAYILLSYDIKPKHTGIEMYNWDNNKSVVQNVEHIRYKKIPYLRTKFMNYNNYKELIKYLTVNT